VRGVGGGAGMEDSGYITEDSCSIISLGPKVGLCTCIMQPGEGMDQITIKTTNPKYRHY
jgi:hypothetical protein